MGARFRTTRWTVVLQARDGEPGGADRALSELCAMYWYPLYTYARRCGSGHHEAEDLTQGFFQHLISREGLRHVDRGKGRFRSFLLASMKNFLANEREYRAALKRGGGQVPLSMDLAQAEGWYDCEPMETMTPERHFERAWAMALLRGALEGLEAEQNAAGRAALFGALRGRLVGDGDEPPIAEIAGRLGMSESNVKVSLHRLRRRFGTLLRARVAETVDVEADVDEELRALMGCFAGDNG